VRASVAENARNTIVIEGDLSVAMVQIADRYVRQVDCYVSPGTAVERGQRVGMNPYGITVRRLSATDPRAASALPPGDRTRAGETVLARY